MSGIPTTQEYTLTASSNTSFHFSTIINSSQQQSEDKLHIRGAVEAESAETHNPVFNDAVTSTIVATNSSIINQVCQVLLENKPNTIRLSTREKSSDLSLGERPAEPNNVGSLTVIAVKNPLRPIESSDENDVKNKEVAIIEGLPSDEMVVYEVVLEYQGVPNPIQVLNDYPHIFIKLCDGEIINAESGEMILNLSQFMVDNKSNEKNASASNTSMPLSSQLIIDSDNVMSTQEPEPASSHRQ